MTSSEDAHDNRPLIFLADESFEHGVDGFYTLVAPDMPRWERVVKNGSKFEYQYAISDHQGNTRILFTSAPQAPTPVTATFEGDSNDQSGQFTNVANVVSFTGANHTTGGIKVVRMNQNYATGPAKSLKVYPGDKVDMEVYGYYENTSGYGSKNTVATMVTAVAGAFGGVSGGGGESGSIFSGVNSALGGFGLGSNSDNTRPSAFINYILFDQSYKVLDMGWQIIPGTPATKNLMTIPQVTVKEAGYIFVYLSYEDQSNNYVYFDDFKVTQTKGNLIQANEYYPFGMQTANSWTRENAVGNQFLHNGGTELNPTSSLYDLDYRNYDPALGRFTQVDPFSVKYPRWSPYSYSLNNPALINDPWGLDPSVTWNDLWAIAMNLWQNSDGGTWSRDAWDRDMASGMNGDCPGCSLFQNTDVVMGKDGTATFYGVTGQAYYSDRDNFAGGNSLVIIESTKNRSHVSSLDASGSIDTRAFAYERSMNPTTIPSFAAGSADLAGNIATYQYLNGLANVSDPKLLSRFTLSAGIVGAGLSITSALYESQQGSFNTHSIVDLGVGLGTFLGGGVVTALGAAGVITTAPAILVGLGVGGVVYGVASVAGGSNLIDEWFDDAGKKWWYTNKE